MAFIGWGDPGEALDGYLRAVGGRLADPALACPAAHGLELSLVTAATARTPGRPPAFELHLAASPPAGRRERRPGFPVLVPATRVVDGAEVPGDPDLVLQFAVCRRAGRALSGPPPAEVFADPPRAWLLEAAAGELRWALGRAPFAYRVLTACRALWLLDQDRLGSKLDAGRWASSRVADPSLVDTAVAVQRGRVPNPTARAELARADRLVESILARLPRTAGAR
jgi:streptomycin 3"-adenylyltransferase